MVEDVVAWLPHSPMLESAHFSSIRWWHQDPSMCSSWATEDDPSYIIFLFNSFSSVQEILPLIKFCLPSTNKFSPMLERGTSTCTLSSHLH
jgi:hypothetical protein